MNLIAGGFHDGVLLYSHALNKTMSQSGQKPPGNVVTKEMWNRTFHGQSLNPGGLYTPLCFMSYRNSNMLSDLQALIRRSVGEKKGLANIY